jgi:hypothetical protein
VPAWNRFLPIPFKQLFPSNLLRIIAVEDLDPSALLAVFHIRTDLVLSDDALHLAHITELRKMFRAMLSKRSGALV